MFSVTPKHTEQSTNGDRKAIVGLPRGFASFPGKPVFYILLL